MFTVTVARVGLKVCWLYENLKEARKAAHFLMHRYNASRAEVAPYCMKGETIIVRR